MVFLSLTIIFCSTIGVQWPPIKHIEGNIAEEKNNPYFWEGEVEFIEFIDFHAYSIHSWNTPRSSLLSYLVQTLRIVNYYYYYYYVDNAPYNMTCFWSWVCFFLVSLFWFLMVGISKLHSFRKFHITEIFFFSCLNFMLHPQQYGAHWLFFSLRNNNDPDSL